jgi:hypothetical protein
LLGPGRINYHTLSDFVTKHGAALDALFVQGVQVLMKAGRVDLERVAHDGTKIQAASRASSKHPQRPAKGRCMAEEHLAALQEQPEGELRSARRKAQQRAAQESWERVLRAEQELPQQQAKKVRVSVTDPEARVMRHPEGGFAPSYNSQIATDGRRGVIVAYGVSQAHEDSHALPPALERIQKNAGWLPKQVLVDGS